MRNIISIDTRDGCSCDAIAITDTKTNEIVIEVITGNDKKPQLKLINGEDTSYITLDANQSNYVNIPSESWVLGGALQFQYEATGRTGELYTISFPDTINDITVSQISETEFSVKSLVIGTQPLTVKDIVNNLNSTDIYKVLGAPQGRELKALIDTNVINIEALEKLVNDNVTGLANKINRINGDYVSKTSNANKLLYDYECHDIGVNGVGDRYVKFATIRAVGAYANAPIKFSIVKRAGYGDVSIQLTGSPSIGYYEIDKFTQSDTLNAPIYAVKVDSGVFDLYMYYTTWENASITRLEMSAYMRGLVIIDWKKEFVDSLPSGYIQAVTTTTTILINNPNGYEGHVKLCKQGKLVVARFGNFKPFLFSGAIIPEGYRPYDTVTFNAIAFVKETDCYNCYVDIHVDGRIDSYLRDTLSSRARNTTHGFYGTVTYFTT